MRIFGMFWSKFLLKNAILNDSKKYIDAPLRPDRLPPLALPPCHTIPS